MKKAVIDIGSNTINLLIASFDDGVFNVLCDNKIHAKLAKGGINQGVLTNEAIERGINALAEHAETINSHGLTSSDVVTFATASLRAAANSDYFTQMVARKFGFNIQIIDGDTEAKLIHAGIKNGFPLTDSPVLVMDIGGGSVEFIITNSQTIFWKRSFNLGVTKLLDKFTPSDPIVGKEIETVNDYVKGELSELFAKIAEYSPVDLVGSSGSFDTIKAILQARQTRLRPIQRTYFHISRNELLNLGREMMELTTAQRLSVKGMDAMRAEYFPLAFVIIFSVLKHMPSASVYQCNYALKEGVFFYYFTK
jgi:exopolyphosphatase / guanosine-5'-triphosphate,3'-diphosphate pyrophosphatase